MPQASTSDGRSQGVPLRYRVPNALTILRVAALPVFWVLLWRAPDGQSTAAGVIFAAASLTDWFDGYLARRFDHSTRFGRLADPLADRLLIDSAVLLLWWHDRLPLYALVLILGRDLVLLVGLRAASRHGYELTVIYLGKTATALLMAGLCLIMLTPPSADWPLYVFDLGLALSLLAGVVYLVSARGRLRLETQQEGRR
jgi:cardiolipin synthase